MDSSEELASIKWFAEYMALENTGLVPSVSPTELLPSRVAMADFLGAKQGAGYEFDNHGSLLYEDYVKNLFTRVLQLKWPLSGVIPFHFARGLVAEASGTEIDWAEFAYIKTHPHQSHSGVPRVLPEFLALQTPLPRLNKVIPPPSQQVSTMGYFTVD